MGEPKKGPALIGFRSEIYKYQTVFT